MSEPQVREQKIKLRSELANYIDSRLPVIMVVVDEEDRFLRVEESVLTSTKRIERIYTWDFNGQLHDRKASKTVNFQHPSQAIQWFARPPLEDGVAPSNEFGMDPPENNSILIMFDALYHMKDSQNTGHSNPGLTRNIKNSQSNLMRYKRNLILVSHTDQVPPELEHHLSVVRYPLPDLPYLRSIVQRGCKWFASAEDQANPQKWLQMTVEEEIDVATLLLGFRGMEAENILARSAHENLRMHAQDHSIKQGFDIETLRNAKVEMIRSNPALRIVIPKPLHVSGTGMDMIGGAGELKKWWLTRQRFFSEEAKLEGIKMPKGAIIVGTGGTGKDNAVEHLAEVIGWTCLYADLGASKGPLQGQSHKGYREIVEAAEAQAPCFMILSEWEKTMAAAFNSTGATIDPTSSEIFASFLNWMQNRTVPVFIWALSNDISSIPQAALRAQRWDKIFFMDLPEQWERKDIIKIHLRKTGWDAENYNIDVERLAIATEGYTGAEIEAVVQEAIGLKYIQEGTKASGKFLTLDHLLEAQNLVVPSYKLKKAEIEGLRNYATTGNLARANSKKENSDAPVEPVRRKKAASAVQQLL